MNLPRSTYYHQSKNPSGNDSELIARIEAIIEEFPGYGYRRVTYELHRRGIPVNHKKVLRIMCGDQPLVIRRRRLPELHIFILKHSRLRPLRAGKIKKSILHVTAS